MGLCTCGAETTPRSDKCRTCTVRLAQARYRRTAKGVAAQKRYIATELGRQLRARDNARRIYVGIRYHSRTNAEKAKVIRQHIREKLRAFTRQQTGTQT